jgi:hypothetical protein
LVGGEDGADDADEEKEDEAEEKGEAADGGPMDGREEGRGGGNRRSGSVDAMLVRAEITRNGPDGRQSCDPTPA